MTRPEIRSIRAASGYSTESREVRTGSTTSGPGPTRSPRETIAEAAGADSAGGGGATGGGICSIFFGTEIRAGAGAAGSIATGTGTGAALVATGAPTDGELAATSPGLTGFALACFSSSFCFCASCFLTSSSTWLSVRVVDAGGSAALEVAGTVAVVGGFTGIAGAEDFCRKKMTPPIRAAAAIPIPTMSGARPFFSASIRFEE